MYHTDKKCILPSFSFSFSYRKYTKSGTFERLRIFYANGSKELFCEHIPSYYTIPLQLFYRILNIAQRIRLAIMQHV